MNFLIITHGYFELVRDVWLFISSLFGSGEFKGLLTGVFVFALVLAAASGALETLFDLKSDGALKWMKGMFIGLMMYFAIGPTTAQVTIYDDVSGQTQIQGNVPVGIAAVAGFVNQITIGMEDLIKTFLATPATPEDVGYERGLKMLQESFDGVMKTALATQVAPQMWDSAYYYVKDCVAIEAARSSAYRATLDDTTDALTSWSNAANPALYTYTALDTAGNPLTGNAPKENVTCFDAWNRMNLYFNGSPAWQHTVEQFCNMMHFDSTDVQSLQACHDVYEKAVELWVLGGASKSAEDVAKNIMLGRVWYSFLASLNDSIETARVAAYARVSSQLAGAGLMAQEWLPVIKVVIFVILVAITPLVFIFLITPYGLDAFKFLLGSFFWWGIWCAIDQMMLSMWLNRVDVLFQAVNQGGNLGVDGLAAIWPLASKATAILGSMRGFGMLLASTLTFVIIRFGGSSFAHLAAGLGRATTSGTGAATAAGFMSPEEREWERTMEAVATYNQKAQAAIAAGGYGGIDYFTRGTAEAAVSSEVASLEGYRDLSAALGTSGPVSTGQALAPGVAGRQVEGVARGSAALGAGASNLASMYQARYTEGIARGKEYQGILDKVKADTPGITTDLAAARYLANPEMAKKYGVSEGLYREYANLADAGVIDPGTTSLADYSAMKEGLRGTMGGADVFAFAREAGDHGLTPAQAAYGKSLFSYANALSRMQSFKEMVGKGDYASAGRLLGDFQGAVEGLRATAGGLGVDQAKFIEAQKVLNESAKMYVNSAVGHWLQEGKLPQGVKSTLDKITSTPEGKRFLQKHMNDLELAYLSPEQARRLNDLSEAAGHGRPFKAGDTVEGLAFGYTGNAEAPFALSTANPEAGIKSRRGDIEDLNLSGGTLGDRRKMLSLAAKADKAGFKGAATHLRMMAAEGKGAHIRASYAPDGKMTKIEMETGGKWIDMDKGEMDYSTHTRALVFDPSVGDYTFKEGQLVYDRDTNQYRLVSGSVSYGIGKHLITKAPGDPSKGIPGGYIAQDLRTEPRTGQVVAGRKTSLLIYEGAVTRAGQTFSGRVVEDAATGNILVADAKSGAFYEYTEAGQHWRVYRGWEGRGSYLLSRWKDIATWIGGEEFGVAATQVAGDVASGVGEIYRAGETLFAIKNWGGKLSGKPSPPNPDKSPSGPTILGPDGKTPASQYKSTGGGPRETITFH